MPLETLYLIRHGKAEGVHPDGDRHRALSAEGRARIEAVLSLAEGRDFHAALTLSSPYLRATQTRDFFLAVLGPTRNETSKVFTPSAEPSEAYLELAAWESAGYSRIAVFTHNPFVTLLAHLLSVPGAVSDLVFHTSTVLALGFEHGLKPSEGRPLWILQP
jgi:phosphohistidine phosphatase SixA